MDTTVNSRVWRLLQDIEDTPGFTITAPSSSSSGTYTVSYTDDTGEQYRARVDARVLECDNAAFARLEKRLERDVGWTIELFMQHRADSRWQEMEQIRVARYAWTEDLAEEALALARRQVRTSKMVFTQEVIEPRDAYDLLIAHEMACRRRGLTGEPEVVAANDLDSPRQRKQSSRRADHLGNVIGRLEWLLTHQGVAVAADGFLVDGQHRLLAVARSGFAAALTMCANVPDECFAVIDTGKARTLADVLYMMGYTKHPAPMSSATRLLWYVENTGSRDEWYRETVTEEQIHQSLMNEHPSFPLVFDIAQRYHSGQSMLVNKSALTVLYYRSLEAWPAAPVHEFWSVVQSGQNSDRPNNPAIALRNWATTWKTRPTREPGRKGRGPIEHYAVAVRCWNLWCQNQELKTTTHDPRIEAPEPYAPGQPATGRGRRR